MTLARARAIHSSLVLRAIPCPKGISPVQKLCLELGKGTNRFQGAHVNFRYRASVRCARRRGSVSR